MKLKILFIALLVFVCLPVFAQDSDDTTIKVENGVTVKTPAANLAPEKTASEQREDYPVQAPPAKAASSSPAAASADQDDEETDESEPPPSHKVSMKPIIDKSSKAKKPEAKNVENSTGPFKKSQDAGVSETVKKPQASPQVTGKPLGDDEGDISGDLQNLDAIKRNKDKATNADDGVGESGLPIPRFVSLKSGEANARTGPGDTYPIRWVYQRKNLPVEVTAEFKLWRRIKDFDGEQSWVHQALLSSRRYCILQRDATAQSEDEGGHKVARFKRGVQVQLDACKAEACKVQYGNIEGWLKKKDLWGVYPAEVFE